MKIYLENLSFKIPSTKLQIPNNFQCPNIQTVLNLDIGAYLKFGIWDL